MSGEVPFTRFYNLGRLGKSGDKVRLELNETERRELADFSGVVRIEAFKAKILLAKLSSDRFRLDFVLDARIVQACVVTLAELDVPIRLSFTRELDYAPLPKESAPPEALTDDDGPEKIASLHYDLARPAIEELILNLDPYPRAAGVEFAAPEDDVSYPQSPFAVLKSLKSGR